MVNYYGSQDNAMKQMDIATLRGELDKVRIQVYHELNDESLFERKPNMMCDFLDIYNRRLSGLMWMACMAPIQQGVCGRTVLSALTMSVACGLVSKFFPQMTDYQVPSVLQQEMQCCANVSSKMSALDGLLSRMEHCTNRLLYSEDAIGLARLKLREEVYHRLRVSDVNTEQVWSDFWERDDALVQLGLDDGNRIYALDASTNHAIALFVREDMSHSLYFESLFDNSCMLSNIGFVDMDGKPVYDVLKPRYARQQYELQELELQCLHRLFSDASDMDIFLDKAKKGVIIDDYFQKMRYDDAVVFDEIVSGAVDIDPCFQLLESGLQDMPVGICDFDKQQHLCVVRPTFLTSLELWLHDHLIFSPKMWLDKSQSLRVWHQFDENGYDWLVQADSCEQKARELDAKWRVGFSQLFQKNAQLQMLNECEKNEYDYSMLR